MRRTVLLILMILVMLPAIGQEVLPIRNCRPQLERIDLSKHMQRRASARSGSEGDVKENPLIGERRQLVVLAAFADQGFGGDSLSTMTKWDRILNTRNLVDEKYVGSMHDYFYDQSYGQFSLSFDLFYVVADSMDKYHSTYIDDENSKYLVQDVISIIKDRVDDWGVYDWDNDDEVDQLLIIYAGEGQNTGGGTNTIWPHQWWMSAHENCERVPVTTGSETYYIDTYCAVSELAGINDTFGTLCHEYSHCFGLPDLYYSTKQFWDQWDLMDYGNFSGNGLHPCGYSAFERAFVGWLSPVELNNDTVIVGMKALSDEPISYLIRNEGYADEYYLVENRQRKGWDESLPGSGILVVHVDYDEELFLTGYVNTDKEQRCVIIPANDNPVVSNLNVKGWAYPYNNNNSLTNTSKPAAQLNNLNIDGSLLMSKPITGMAVTEGTASFSFKNLLTSVPYVMDERLSGKAGWFTIDGRPLPGKPFVHGLYIHQGKVVLVR